MNDDSYSSARKRARSRATSRSPNTNNGRQQQSQRQKGSSKDKGSSKVNPLEFWGDRELLPLLADSDLLPTADHTAEQSTDTRALLNSLGRPPLQGQETVAERWLTLVYERASALAEALAAAGELDSRE